MNKEAQHNTRHYHNKNYYNNINERYKMKFIQNDHEYFPRISSRLKWYLTRTGSIIHTL